MRILFLIILLYFTTIPITIGQVFNTAYKFETYTTKEGVSDNAINKTLTDKNGFLWIATKNGLNKFNGTTFKKYTYIPGDSTSLRSIWVSDLLLDNNGLLWVSTEWGICYYDEKYDNFHYINKKQDVQVLYKAPMCIGAQNIIWIAAEDGLKKIDVVKKTITNTALSNISDPQCILYNANQTIWIGTRGHGLFQFNTVTNTFTITKNLPISNEAHIMDLYTYSKQLMYAATSEGLIEIDENNTIQLYNKGINVLSTLLCNELMCITKFTALTGEGKILCGSYNNNLFVFDIILKKFTEKLNNTTDNLSDYPKGVFSNLNSTEQNLWLATDNGLSKLNLAQQDVVSQPILFANTAHQNILIKQILSINKSNDELWMVMGKEKGGIMKYFKSKHILLPVLKQPTQPNYQPIYIDAILDTGAYVWAFTNNKIDRYNIHTIDVKSVTLPRTLMSATMDNQHNFWIGTSTGILYYNTVTEKTTIFDYHFNGTIVENTSFAEGFPVVGIKNGTDENVWLTSIKYGLFSFNKVTHQYTPHRQPFNLAYETKNRCSSLLLYTDGTIWYGTMAGLSCYNPSSNTFANYNTSNGLQSTYVYSIGCDANQQIWGMGNTGVFSFNPITKIFKNYALAKNQSSAFFNQKISITNGQVLMGYQGGYNIFTSLQTNNNTNIQTFITHVMVVDNPFYFDSTNNANHPAIFNSQQNIFKFNFTAVNFETPNTTNFFYQLEGADNNWIKADEQSFALYSNLAPGQYTFKVKASATNNALLGQIKYFYFTIKKPFWQTTTFILLAILVSGALIWLLYKYRIAQIEMAYLMRSDISRNLHDEIGATLSSINIYSEVARKKNNDIESTQLLTKIYEASTKAMDSMSDIVWYINPKNDILENMLVKMREYALPLLEAKNVQVIFIADATVDTIKLSMQQRQHVYLIFKEAINNIAKYAAAKNVHIHVYKKDQTLFMKIIDDGNGFDDTITQTGNGLQNIQHRCNELKGKLQINTTIRQGTSIQIYFKIA